MFKYAKIIVLVSVTFAFASGMSVNAQMMKEKPQVKQKQRLNQQTKANRPPMAARRMGAGLMSIEGLLLPPARERIALISKRIGLDAKQQARLIALSNRFYKSMKTVLVDRAKSMQEIRRIMISQKLSGSSLKSAAEKVHKADKKILDAEIKFWVDFNDILTPQQQMKFNRMRQPIGGNQQSKMNKRRGGMRIPNPDNAR